MYIFYHQMAFIPNYAHQGNNKIAYNLTMAVIILRKNYTPSFFIRLTCREVHTYMHDRYSEKILYRKHLANRGHIPPRYRPGARRRLYGGKGAYGPTRCIQSHT